MVSVSSVTLTMGPEQLDFTNDINCQSATIKTEGIKTVTGKILFSEAGFNARKLSRHNLTPEERGVEVVFPTEVVVDNKAEIEVCLSAPYGDYHGIILYKIKDAPIQVGIWINASFSGGESVSIIHMAGKKLENVDAISLLGVTGTVWMIVLIGLVVVWRRSEKNSHRDTHKGHKNLAKLDDLAKARPKDKKEEESEFMDY